MFTLEPQFLLRKVALCSQKEIDHGRAKVYFNQLWRVLIMDKRTANRRGMRQLFTKKVQFSRIRWIYQTICMTKRNSDSTEHEFNQFWPLPVPSLASAKRQSNKQRLRCEFFILQAHAHTTVSSLPSSNRSGTSTFQLYNTFPNFQLPKRDDIHSCGATELIH